MDGNKELTAKQKRVILYLLTAPSIEEGFAPFVMHEIQVGVNASRI
jgi:hypothetical protein